MGVATGCGCKEVYRFPHSLLLLYLFLINPRCACTARVTVVVLCVCVCVCVCVCLSHRNLKNGCVKHRTEPRFVH